MFAGLIKLCLGHPPQRRVVVVVQLGAPFVQQPVAGADNPIDAFVDVIRGCLAAFVRCVKLFVLPLEVGLLNTNNGLELGQRVLKLFGSIMLAVASRLHSIHEQIARLLPHPVDARTHIPGEEVASSEENYKGEPRALLFENGRYHRYDFCQ